jgi:3-phosphoshikimate 1-carboxyvinyltransferase
MGGQVCTESSASRAGEPVADLRVTSADLGSTTVSGAEVPRLIDELPLLAVVASQASGETVIRDAAELRHKESDRVAATVDLLRRLGAEAEELPDGLVVAGPCRLTGGTVGSYGDHRIAMAAAVAGLVASGPVTITNADAVAVSYPEFFADLESVTVR